MCTINNIETSYFTQLKICYLMTMFRYPSDILIVYSSMEHVTWKSPGPCGWVGRILHPDSCTSVSSWSKVPLLFKSAITDHAVEENHVIDWDEAKVVDREAQRQTRWIKEVLWIRKTHVQLSHTWDQVISRSRAPSSCKQSRRDQDVQRTSKRCH